ncbi:hypothetical protein ACFW81_24115 [Streptomyces angustmyceticus]|uniref:hypothetical protein n=1 Tax=Streptomyces angustmyceticus TaxID=285578 RepID=UPI0036BC2B00
MVAAQLDVEGREVPATAVGVPPLPARPVPSPKPATVPPPLPELVGQLGIPLIPEVHDHDPAATLF